MKKKEINSTFFEGDIEAGISAICDLADGMCSAFDCTLEGVITWNDKKSRSENAYDWLIMHYQACAGALRAIYFIADAISTPLIDGDAEIVCAGKES